MEWMILPLKRYAQFSGRSQRKEYWMFFLFNFLVRIVLIIAQRALGLSTQSATDPTPGGVLRAGALSWLWSLAIFIPTIAVTIRRLHDTNHSGWWLLGPFGAALIAGGMLVALPAIAPLSFLVVGVVWIILLIALCLDGTHGPNRFGADPKGVIADLEETFR